MWKYQGKILKNTSEFYGFIYKITDDKNRIYIGKKAFIHHIRKRLSKKARKSTRKRVEVVEKDSNWKNYWGSCKPLLEYIKENGTSGFKREVLILCKDRTNLNYWEIYAQFKENVLLRDDCWNTNIGGKWFKGKIYEQNNTVIKK